MSEQVVYKSSIPVFGILGIILTVMKLLEVPSVADLSWWWVVACFFAGVVIFVAIITGALVVAGIAFTIITILENWNTRWMKLGLLGLLLFVLAFLLSGCGPRSNSNDPAPYPVTYKKVCIDGIIYHRMLSGYHLALSPAIDPDTLSFTRCNPYEYSDK